MVIDTGAEMMSVTNSVARSLYEKGEAETNGDYMSFRMADGSARTQQIIIVKSLTIGSHILTNVPASVVADGASMLIPFPVLNRIGKFTIDATNGTLTFQ
jgi:predicted aspartyl protease